MDVLDRPKGSGTQAEMMKDPRWNTVPPVGDRPISNRWKFLFLILVVFMVKLVIWSIYRWSTGNLSIFTDPENGRALVYWSSLFAKPILQLGPVFFLWWYLFREKGTPFRFTRKNLTSSIIWGCLGGLVFFIVATAIYVGHMRVMGYGTDFHMAAGWDDLGWGLIIAMMFSYMISTGPAEELFSRGFLQDQSARVFSIPMAIGFSTVLFAVGHLPISIMMYRMPLINIFWYMLILVLMGVFFSIIYHWSRNIVLGIIIHGLWDWYLSLFGIKGAFTTAFIDNASTNFGRIDFINTVLTAAVMLPFFYLLYRVFWKRYTDGDDGRVRFFDDMRDSLWNRPWVKWIRSRDRGTWPRRPWIATFTAVGLFCLAMLPLAAVVGTDDPEYKSDRYQDPVEGRDVFDVYDIHDFGNLNEGGEITYELDDLGYSMFSVNVTVEWADEPAERPGYRNGADIFEATISDGGGVLKTMTGSGGTIDLDLDLGKDASYNGTITVTLVLIDAGDQSARIGPGIFPIEDTSNDYAIDIEFTTWHYIEGTGDSPTVRW